MSEKTVETREEEFEEELEELKKAITEKAEKAEEDVRCSTVEEYVDTFRHSGAAQIQAQGQLESLGLEALGTPEGIDWLVDTVPSTIEN